MDLKERLEGAGGHLFQNRYKSIVCEEELYLLELVRYFHLTPLCAGLVPDMAALSRYRWCGHSVLLRPAGSAASATKKKPAGHQSAQRPLLLRRARNGDKRGAAGGTNAQHQPRGGELCRWPRGGLVAAVPRLWEMFGAPSPFRLPQRHWNSLNPVRQYSPECPPLL